MLKIDNNSNKVKVSVVIPAWNEELYLRDTLQTLLEQDYEEPVEIIISDNNSTDRTPEIAKEMGARVVKEEKKGSRFAYDTGMRSAKGELILVTNADVRLPKNWVSSLVKVYEDPEVVGAGTAVEFYDAPSYVNFFLKFLAAISPKKGIWGTSLSCRKWVFEKVGGFDHGVNTNEDAIFCLLMEKFGKVVITNESTVLMNGRRYNQGLWNTIKEWLKGIGLNSAYIQLTYFFTGEVKSWISDFGDIRSSVFGKGEDTQITIIIPTNNDQETISQTLTSIQRQDFPQRFKVYILDNYSIDLSIQLAKIFPGVNIASYPGVYNLAEKLHLLLNEIDSPVVAFTTAKSILPDDWLSTIYKEFNKKRKNTLDIITGPYMQVNSRMLSTLTNQPIDKLSGKFEFHNFAITKEKAKQIILKKGNLEEIVNDMEKHTLKDKDLIILYAMNLKSYNLSAKFLESFISDSTKSVTHTIKKILSPITS